jgi:hypothetical protein
MKEGLISLDSENGLTIIGDAFIANSGFKYASGYRDFGSLKIVEDVAGGTAVAFLCGIKVYDKEGTLIIDKNVKNGVHFEREVVRKIVLKELLNMLIDINQDNENFDFENAKSTIDFLLKQAYFESSYKAITNWGLELGIINS